jgi:hypothetical protein
VSSHQKKLTSQIALLQDTIAEYRTDNQQESVLLSKQGNRFEKKTDIATCLMARDYKGFGNQLFNGVIEWRNNNS